MENIDNTKPPVTQEPEYLFLASQINGVKPSDMFASKKNYRLETFDEFSQMAKATNPEIKDEELNKNYQSLKEGFDLFSNAKAATQANPQFPGMGYDPFQGSYAKIHPEQIAKHLQDGYIDLDGQYKLGKSPAMLIDGTINVTKFDPKLGYVTEMRKLGDMQPSDMVQSFIGDRDFDSNLISSLVKGAVDGAIQKSFVAVTGILAATDDLFKAVYNWDSNYDNSRSELNKINNSVSNIFSGLLAKNDDEKTKAFDDANAFMYQFGDGIGQIVGMIGFSKAWQKGHTALRAAISPTEVVSTYKHMQEAANWGMQAGLIFGGAQAAALQRNIAIQSGVDNFTASVGFYPWMLATYLSESVFGANLALRNALGNKNFTNQLEKQIAPIAAELGLITQVGAKQKGAKMLTRRLFNSIDDMLRNSQNKAWYIKYPMMGVEEGTEELLEGFMNYPENMGINYLASLGAENTLKAYNNSKYISEKDEFGAINYYRQDVNGKKVPLMYNVWRSGKEDLENAQKWANGEKPIPLEFWQWDDAIMAAISTPFGGAIGSIGSSQHQNKLENEKKFGLQEIALKIKRNSKGNQEKIEQELNKLTEALQGYVANNKNAFGTYDKYTDGTRVAESFIKTLVDEVRLNVDKALVHKIDEVEGLQFSSRGRTLMHEAIAVWDEIQQVTNYLSKINNDEAISEKEYKIGVFDDKVNSLSKAEKIKHLEEQQVALQSKLDYYIKPDSSIPGKKTSLAYSHMYGNEEIFEENVKLNIQNILRQDYIKKNKGASETEIEDYVKRNTEASLSNYRNGALKSMSDAQKQSEKIRAFVFGKDQIGIVTTDPVGHYQTMMKHLQDIYKTKIADWNRGKTEEEIVQLQKRGEDITTLFSKLEEHLGTAKKMASDLKSGVSKQSLAELDEIITEELKSIAKVAQYSNDAVSQNIREKAKQYNQEFLNLSAEVEVYDPAGLSFDELDTFFEPKNPEITEENIYSQPKIYDIIREQTLNDLFFKNFDIRTTQTTNGIEQEIGMRKGIIGIVNELYDDLILNKKDSNLDYDSYFAILGQLVGDTGLFKNYHDKILGISEYFDSDKLPTEHNPNRLYSDYSQRLNSEDIKNVKGTINEITKKIDEILGSEVARKFDKQKAIHKAHVKQFVIDLNIIDEITDYAKDNAPEVINAYKELIDEINRLRKQTGLPEIATGKIQLEDLMELESSLFNSYNQKLKDSEQRVSEVLMPNIQKLFNKLINSLNDVNITEYTNDILEKVKAKKENYSKYAQLMPYEKKNTLNMKKPHTISDRVGEFGMSIEYTYEVNLDNIAEYLNHRMQWAHIIHRQKETGHLYSEVLRTIGTNLKSLKDKNLAIPYTYEQIQALTYMTYFIMSPKTILPTSKWTNTDNKSLGEQTWDNKILTLLGFAGTGKTTIALDAIEIAQQLLKETKNVIIVSTNNELKSLHEKSNEKTSASMQYMTLKEFHANDKLNADIIIIDEATLPKESTNRENISKIIKAKAIGIMLGDISQSNEQNYAFNYNPRESQEHIGPLSIIHRHANRSVIQLMQEAQNMFYDKTLQISKENHTIIPEGILEGQEIIDDKGNILSKEGVFFKKSNREVWDDYFEYIESGKTDAIMIFEDNEQRNNFITEAKKRNLSKISTIVNNTRVLKLGDYSRDGKVVIPEENFNVSGLSGSRIYLGFEVFSFPESALQFIQQSYQSSEKSEIGRNLFTSSSRTTNAGFVMIPFPMYDEAKSTNKLQHTIEQVKSSNYKAITPEEFDSSIEKVIKDLDESTKISKVTKTNTKTQSEPNPDNKVFFNDILANKESISKQEKKVEDIIKKNHKSNVENIIGRVSSLSFVEEGIEFNDGFVNDAIVSYATQQKLYKLALKETQEGIVDEHADLNDAEKTLLGILKETIIHFDTIPNKDNVIVDDKTGKVFMSPLLLGKNKNGELISGRPFFIKVVGKTLKNEPIVDIYVKTNYYGAEENLDRDRKNKMLQLAAYSIMASQNGMVVNNTNLLQYKNYSKEFKKFGDLYLATITQIDLQEYKQQLYEQLFQNEPTKEVTFEDFWNVERRVNHNNLQEYGFQRVINPSKTYIVNGELVQGNRIVGYSKYENGEWFGGYMIDDIKVDNITDITDFNSLDQFSQSALEYGKGLFYAMGLTITEDMNNLLGLPSTPSDNAWFIPNNNLFIKYKQELADLIQKAKSVPVIVEVLDTKSCFNSETKRFELFPFVTQVRLNVEEMQSDTVNRSVYKPILDHIEKGIGISIPKNLVQELTVIAHERDVEINYNKKNTRYAEKLEKKGVFEEYIKTNNEDDAEKLFEILSQQISFSNGNDLQDNYKNENKEYNIAKLKRIREIYQANGIKTNVTNVYDSLPYEDGTVRTFEDFNNILEQSDYETIKDIKQVNDETKSSKAQPGALVFVGETKSKNFGQVIRINFYPNPETTANIEAYINDFVKTKGDILKQDNFQDAMALIEKSDLYKFVVMNARVMDNFLHSEDKNSATSLRFTRDQIMTLYRFKVSKNNISEFKLTGKSIAQKIDRLVKLGEVLKEERHNGGEYIVQNIWNEANKINLDAMHTKTAHINQPNYGIETIKKEDSGTIERDIDYKVVRNEITDNFNNTLDSIRKDLIAMIGVKHMDKVDLFMDIIIKYGKDERVVGMLEQGRIKIFGERTLFYEGVGKHEGVHFIIRHLLTNSEQQQLIESASKEMPKGYKGGVHEFIANAIESKEIKSKQPTTIFGRIVKMIKDFFLIFHRRPLGFREFIDNVSEGYYSNRKFIGRSYQTDYKSIDRFAGRTVQNRIAKVLPNNDAKSNARIKIERVSFNKSAWSKHLIEDANFIDYAILDTFKKYSYDAKQLRDNKDDIMIVDGQSIPILEWVNVNGRNKPNLSYIDIKNLIREGKVPSSTLDKYVTLALSDREVFFGLAKQSFPLINMEDVSNLKKKKSFKEQLKDYQTGKGIIEIKTVPFQDAAQSNPYETKNPLVERALSSIPLLKEKSSGIFTPEGYISYDKVDDIFITIKERLKNKMNISNMTFTDILNELEIIIREEEKYKTEYYYNVFSIYNEFADTAYRISNQYKSSPGENTGRRRLVKEAQSGLFNNEKEKVFETRILGTDLGNNKSLIGKAQFWQDLEVKIVEDYMNNHTANLMKVGVTDSRTTSSPKSAIKQKIKNNIAFQNYYDDNSFNDRADKMLSDVKVEMKMSGKNASFIVSNKDGIFSPKKVSDTRLLYKLLGLPENFVSAIKMIESNQDGVYTQADHYHFAAMMLGLMHVNKYVFDYINKNSSNFKKLTAENADIKSILPDNLKAIYNEIERFAAEKNYTPEIVGQGTYSSEELKNTENVVMYKPMDFYKEFDAIAQNVIDNSNISRNLMLNIDGNPYFALQTQSELTKITDNDNIVKLKQQELSEKLKTEPGKSALVYEEKGIVEYNNSILKPKGYRIFMEDHGQMIAINSILKEVASKNATMGDFLEVMVENLVKKTLKGSKYKKIMILHPPKGDKNMALITKILLGTELISSGNQTKKLLNEDFTVNYEAFVPVVNDIVNYYNRLRAITLEKVGNATNIINSFRTQRGAEPIQINEQYTALDNEAIIEHDGLQFTEVELAKYLLERNAQRDIKNIDGVYHIKIGNHYTMFNTIFNSEFLDKWNQSDNRTKQNLLEKIAVNEANQLKEFAREHGKTISTELIDREVDIRDTEGNETKIVVKKDYTSQDMYYRLMSIATIVFNESFSQAFTSPATSFASIVDMVKRTAKDVAPKKSFVINYDGNIKRGLKSSLNIVKKQDIAIQSKIFGENIDGKFVGKISKEMFTDGLAISSIVNFRRFYYSSGGSLTNVHAGNIKPVITNYDSYNQFSEYIKNGMTVMTEQDYLNKNAFLINEQKAMLGEDNWKLFEILYNETKDWNGSIDRLIDHLDENNIDTVDILAFESTVKTQGVKIIPGNLDKTKLSTLDNRSYTQYDLALHNNKTPSSAIGIQSLTQSSILEHYKTVPVQIARMIKSLPHNAELARKIDNILTETLRLAIEDYQRIKPNGTKNNEWLKFLNNLANIHVGNTVLKRDTLAQNPNNIPELSNEKHIENIITHFNSSLQMTMTGVDGVQSPSFYHIYIDKKTGIPYTLEALSKLYPNLNIIDDSVDIEGYERRQLNTRHYVDSNNNLLNKPDVLDGKAVAYSPEEVMVDFPFRNKFGIGINDTLQETMSLNINGQIVSLYQPWNKRIDKIEIQKQLEELFDKNQILDNFLDTIILPNIKNTIKSRNRGSDIEKMAKYFADFNNALDIFVLRVPSTGSNSATPARIIEFTRNKKNVLIHNPESNFFTGADYDNDPIQIYFRTLNGVGGIAKSKKKSLQNDLFNAFYEFYNNLQNADIILQETSKEEANKYLKEQDNEANPFPNNLSSPVAMLRTMEIVRSGNNLIGHFANMMVFISELYGLDINIQKDSVSDEISIYDDEGNLIDKDIIPFMKEVISIVGEAVNLAVDNINEAGALGRLNIVEQNTNLIAGILLTFTKSEYKSMRKGLFDTLKDVAVVETVRSMRNKKSIYSEQYTQKLWEALDTFMNKRDTSVTVTISTNKPASETNIHEFSPYYKRPFELNGVQYESIEHAYQTLKNGTFNSDFYNGYQNAENKYQFIKYYNDESEGVESDVKSKQALYSLLIDASISKTLDKAEITKFFRNFLYVNNIKVPGAEFQEGLANITKRKGNTDYSLYIRALNEKISAMRKNEEMVKPRTYIAEETKVHIENLKRAAFAGEQLNRFGQLSKMISGLKSDKAETQAVISRLLYNLGFSSMKQLMSYMNTQSKTTPEHSIESQISNIFSPEAKLVSQKGLKFSEQDTSTESRMEYERKIRSFINLAQVAYKQPLFREYITLLNELNDTINSFGQVTQMPKTIEVLKNILPKVSNTEEHQVINLIQHRLIDGHLVNKIAGDYFSFQTNGFELKYDMRTKEGREGFVDMMPSIIFKKKLDNDFWRRLITKTDTLGFDVIEFTNSKWIKSEQDKIYYQEEFVKLPEEYQKALALYHLIIYGRSTSNGTWYELMPEGIIEDTFNKEFNNITKEIEDIIDNPFYQASILAYFPDFKLKEYSFESRNPEKHERISNKRGQTIGIVSEINGNRYKLYPTMRNNIIPLGINVYQNGSETALTSISGLKFVALNKKEIIELSKGETTIYTGFGRNIVMLLKNQSDAYLNHKDKVMTALGEATVTLNTVSKSNEAFASSISIKLSPVTTENKVGMYKPTSERVSSATTIESFLELAQKTFPNIRFVATTEVNHAELNNGVYYYNPTSFHLETHIHELGHINTLIIQQANPELYDKMRREAVDMINNKHAIYLGLMTVPGYQNYSGERLIHEVMATTMGMVDQEKLESWLNNHGVIGKRNFVQRIFDSIKSGVKKVTDFMKSFFSSNKLKSNYNSTLREVSNDLLKRMMAKEVITFSDSRMIKDLMIANDYTKVSFDKINKINNLNDFNSQFYKKGENVEKFEEDNYIKNTIESLKYDPRLTINGKLMDFRKIEQSKWEDILRKTILQERPKDRDDERDAKIVKALNEGASDKTFNKYFHDSNGDSIYNISVVNSIRNALLISNFSEARYIQYSELGNEKSEILSKYPELRQLYDKKIEGFNPILSIRSVDVDGTMKHYISIHQFTSQKLYERQTNDMQRLLSGVESEYLQKLYNIQYRKIWQDIAMLNLTLLANKFAQQSNVVVDEVNILQAFGNQFKGIYNDRIFNTKQLQNLLKSKNFRDSLSDDMLKLFSSTAYRDSSFEYTSLLYAQYNNKLSSSDENGHAYKTNHEKDIVKNFDGLSNEEKIKVLNMRIQTIVGMMNKENPEPPLHAELIFLAKTIMELNRNHWTREYMNTLEDLRTFEVFTSLQYNIPHEALSFITDIAKNTESIVVRKINDLNKNGLDKFVNHFDPHRVEWTDKSYQRYEKLKIYKEGVDENNNKVKFWAGSIAWTTDKNLDPIGYEYAKTLDPKDLAMGKWFVDMVTEKYVDMIIHKKQQVGIKLTREQATKLLLEGNSNGTIEFAYRRGQVPLVSATTTEMLAKKGIFGGVKKWAQRNTNAFIDFDDLIKLEDKKNGLSYLDEIPDQFYGQITIPGNDPGVFNSLGKADLLKKMLGISMENGNMIIDLKKQQQISTDFEYIAKMFSMSMDRKIQYEQNVLPAINGVRALLTRMSDVYSQDAKYNQKNALHFLNNYVQYVTLGKRKQIKPEKVDKIIMNTMNLASSGVMFMNFNVGILSASHNMLTSFIEGLSGTLINAVSSNKNNGVYYTLSDLTKAQGDIISKRNLLSQLGMDNQIWNATEYEMVTHYLNQKGKHHLASSHISNYTNWAADYIARGIIMAAYMRNKGITGAISQNTDGTINYDEKKDKRFWTNGKQSLEQKAILEFYKREQVKEGLIKSIDDKLASPFILNDSRAIRVIASQYVTGAFSKTETTLLGSEYLGSFYKTFKTFFITKYDNAVQKGSYSKDLGNVAVYKDPNTGEYVAKWQQQYMEGYLLTLGKVIKDLWFKDSGIYTSEYWINNPHRTRNMIRWGSMMATFFSSYILYALLVSKEKDDEKPIPNIRLIRNLMYSYESLLVIPTLGRFISGESAFASTGIIKRFVEGVWEMDYKKLSSSIGIGGSTLSFYELYNVLGKAQDVIDANIENEKLKRKQKKKENEEK